MTQETFRFQIDRITPESPRVKTFRLRPEGSGLPFIFSPGQHLGVRPVKPGVPDPEHGKWRHFSLSSSPSEDCLEITVLNQGTVSDRMHSLAPGDWVETTRPVGAFVFEEAVGLGLARNDSASLVLPLERIAGVERVDQRDDDDQGGSGCGGGLVVTGLRDSCTLRIAGDRNKAPGLQAESGRRKPAGFAQQIQFASVLS